jgi:hypothetical protein
VQELVDEPQRVLSAEVTAAELVLLLLAVGPNALVAAIRGVVHDEMLVSVFNAVRYDVHPELIPEGMRGLDDWA